MGERRALVVVVAAAACPELSLDEVGAAVEATITNPAVARSLTAALAAGPDVVRAGAPPVVARLVGELRARGSTLAVPACATCGRAGLALIRVGITGVCPRCRSHQLAEACSVCGVVRVVTARGADGTAMCFACAPPAGPALWALRAGAAHRPAGHRRRGGYLRELLSPAGGHLRVVRAAHAVHLRGRRDTDVRVVFAESGGRVRPLRPAAPAMRPLARGPGV